MKSKMKYSVIIPTLNAHTFLDSCLRRVRQAGKDVEVIVIDGGSIDDSCHVAMKHNAIVKCGQRGRGYQLNHGARYATGDIFLFLHADTLLPQDAFSVLDEYFVVANNQVATFKLRFDKYHWLLNFYGNMTKYDSLWTSFGDQGIAVKKSFYESIGGFPNWPLFEDVDFLRKARREGRVASLNAEVTTSADKYLKNGFFRQQLKNGWLMLQYLGGVSPERLSYEYNH